MTVEFKRGNQRTHIALLDAHALEDVGSPAHLLEELLISQLDVLSGLVSFPNDGSLVRLRARESKSDHVSHVNCTTVCITTQKASSPCWGVCKPSGPRNCKTR